MKKLVLFLVLCASSAWAEERKPAAEQIKEVVNGPKPDCAPPITAPAKPDVKVKKRASVPITPEFKLSYDEKTDITLPQGSEARRTVGTRMGVGDPERISFLAAPVGCQGVTAEMGEVLAGDPTTLIVKTASDAKPGRCSVTFTGTSDSGRQRKGDVHVVVMPPPPSPPPPPAIYSSGRLKPQFYAGGGLTGYLSKNGNGGALYVTGHFMFDFGKVAVDGGVRLYAGMLNPDYTREPLERGGWGLEALAWPSEMFGVGLSYDRFGKFDFSKTSASVVGIRGVFHPGVVAIGLTVGQSLGPADGIIPKGPVVFVSIGGDSK